jgi:hypothetical protein
MNRACSLLLGLLVGAAFGCGGGDAVQERAVFVGAAADSEAKVAAVRRGDAFTLYVCGGADDIAVHTHWFSGTLTDDALSTSAPDGWEARGAFDESGAHGTFSAADGSTLTWSLDAAPEGSTAGLYGGDDSGCRTGVVVTPGQAAGSDVQGAWCDDEGDYAQVTPIRTIDAQGFRVGAQTPIGRRQILAKPIDPP